MARFGVEVDGGLCRIELVRARSTRSVVRPNGGVVKDELRQVFAPRRASGRPRPTNPERGAEPCPRSGPPREFLTAVEDSRTLAASKWFETHRIGSTIQDTGGAAPPRARTLPVPRRLTLTFAADGMRSKRPTIDDVARQAG